VPAAPALAAATPVPSAAERADKPAVRRAGGDAVARLVAIGAPGKEATSGERELLGAVERAFSARGGNVEMRGVTKSMPAPGRKDVRTEALKHASTADDFRRGAKPARPAAAQQEPEKAASKELAAEPQEEKKAPARSILASKSDLAEAARATRASVEAGIDVNKGVGKNAGKIAGQGAAEATAPAKAAAAQPAGAQPDPAMLTKLAELEGKLKTLQAQLAITNTAGAASVAAPAAGAAHPVAQVAEVARPAAVSAPVSAAVAGAEQHGAAPATAATAAIPAGEAAKPGIAQHDESIGEHVAISAEAASAAAVATVEEPKPKPEEKKAAEPPPPEPKKEIKISRPKLLTFLFAGSLVLLAIFGVIVHFVRKAKMRRSPIVRQSWSRDEDDVPARTEPTAGPVPAPEPAAPPKA
jgi:hypothetical protein